MAVHGYVIKYSIRWPQEKSAYIYQRFFRALYGYKQVVSKGNGRRYVYNRPGVLSKYPYIKEAKTTVIIPDNVLQPLINFLKTGQNPAHRFTFTGNWSEIVKYSMEETLVDDIVAANAVLSAINRTYFRAVHSKIPALSALQDIDVLTPDEIYGIYYALEGIISSNWLRTLQSERPDMYALIQRLLSIV